MPREMPEHIFGYNKSKQINTIHPLPLSSNTMFSSVRFSSIHLQRLGKSEKSSSSNQMAQYTPGCKTSQPESSQPYHSLGFTGAINSFIAVVCVIYSVFSDVGKQVYYLCLTNCFHISKVLVNRREEQKLLSVLA